MNNKYNLRYLPVVSRDESATENYSGKTPSWYDEFVSNLEKNSTNSQRSIYEEISSIMGFKSKHSSVEEAVEDLKERTGLAAFLKSKQASAQDPDIFQKIPLMKVFIDNFVEDRPGTSIESVIHDLLKIDEIRHQLPEKTDLDDEVKSYINSKLIEKKNHNLNDSSNSHLGKVDQSMSEIVLDDPLAICEPSQNK